MAQQNSQHLIPEDPLAPARGCALGAVLGTICWGTLFGLIWLAVG